MTKFANMTVKVPVDDAMPIELMRGHLQKLLDERGTETLSLSPATNGAEAEPQSNGAGLDALAPRVARIHWPAVAVRQTQERTQATPAAPAARRPRAPTT